MGWTYHKGKKITGNLQMTKLSVYISGVVSESKQSDFFVQNVLHSTIKFHLI